jgi:hypothetical protein
MPHQAGPERVAVAIVRVWTEPDREPSLRVRITRIDGMGQEEPDSSVVTSVEAACVLIADWLRAYVDPLAAP